MVPWWRLDVKTKGELNSKYPGGGLIQKSKLEEEGHTILKRGKRFSVEGVQ